MRAAIYARYSSDLQRPASIDDQARQCRAEIIRRGWEEAALYSDSEIGGTISRGRPDYQRLLKAAKAREFDVVVVDELSRLTRDPEELARLRKLVRHWQVGLVALADGLDTIAAPGAASTIIAIKGLTNEIEIEANAHRSRRGLAGRVLAGYHAGGAPYGYRTRPVHDDKPGDPPGTGPVRGHEYIIHESEADTIRRIFRMYVKGMSTRQIAAQLNAEGVPPPGARWKDRQGVRRTWSHGAIFGDPKRGQGILNNVKYIGQLVWNHSTWPRDPERDGKQVRRELPEDQWVLCDAPQLRIVPQELWEAARVRMARRSRERVGEAHHAKQPRLLSGLLVCGKCGGRFVLRGSRIYSCSSRQNRGAVVCDCMATVNAAEAEDRIIAELQDLFCSEELLRRITEHARRLAAKRRTDRQHKQSTTAELRRQLAQVEIEIPRLLDAIAKGALVDDLMARMQAAEARRDSLRQELGEAQKAETIPGIELLPAAVRRVVADLRQMLAAGQVERVRTALCRLVTRIEVHEEERPGRKRPGAYLLLRGNLQAALQLAGEKGTSGCSPGGIRTRDLMAENHAS